MIELIAGTYAGAHDGGLTPLAYDPSAGRIEIGTPDGAFRNASYGARLPGGDWCLVDEGASRIVIAAVADGRWSRIATLGSGGQEPCHVAVDPVSRWIAVANYGDGVVALFRIDHATNQPIDPPALHRPSGHGADPKRQAGPHAHWVGFAHRGERLYTVDLGLDRVMLFTGLSAGALGEPRVAYAAPPGSGPRHMAFHPTLPIAYLVSELASTLTVLRIGDDGSLAERRIVPTLPAGAGAHSYAGAIAIDRAGHRLYVSNRGHDSIAAFAIDAQGDVALIDIVPSGGSSPRFVLLLEAEQRLLVAHDKADGVTVLATGPRGLTPTRAHADLAGVAFLATIDEAR